MDASRFSILIGMCLTSEYVRCFEKGTQKKLYHYKMFADVFLLLMRHQLGSRAFLPTLESLMSSYDFQGQKP